MIETKDLTYQYSGSAPLHFPNFRVKENEALLITGESGCGKTTLLHLLAGLRKPQSGQIIIGKKELSKLSPTQMDQFRGNSIGIVYQQPYFISSLSILDNLTLSPFAGSRDKAETIALRLNISKILSRFPYQISMGQQQRASIARAMMNDPKLILADEPTSALDDKNCAEVIKLLKEEAALNNAILIIVSHDNRLKTEFKNYIEIGDNLKSK